MSLIARTSILALTAIATFGVAALSPSEASAKHWGKPHWGKPWHKPYYPYWHRRHIVYAAPVVVTTGYGAYRATRPAQAAQPAQPNPAACLSKEYTPEGQVVFKDKCTNEMAVAQVPGVQGAGATQQNFAGRTFQDFQSAQNQQPGANQPQGQPSVPQNGQNN